MLNPVKPLDINKELLCVWTFIFFINIYNQQGFYRSNFLLKYMDIL
jgi:hypothetical protein